MSETPEAASLLEVLKELGGESRYARLIDVASAKLEIVDHDNWNGGTDTYELELSVPFALWAPFRGSVAEMHEELLGLVQAFWDARFSDWLRVRVVPADPERVPYRLKAEPLGIGGVGEVFVANPRAGGPEVAFKRLRSQDESARARLRREIEVHLGLNHPNVMPILDHDSNGFAWFTMPLARRSLLTPEPVRIEKVAVDVALGLKHAHEQGFVHRDMAPGNVLQLRTGMWVVADWGLVRRPHGYTTKLLTGAGVFGTEGFIAPEQYDDAHSATSAADTFSLGRCLAWVLADRPRMPTFEIPPGPWSHLLLAMTRKDPARRPTLDEVIGEFQAPREALGAHAMASRLASTSSDEDLSSFLIAAAAAADDAELFLDVLPAIPKDILRRLAEQDETYLVTIAALVARHAGRSWHGRNFDRLNDVLAVPFAFLRGAVERGDWGLSARLSEVYFPFEVQADRYTHRDRVRNWLRSLRGQPATQVASILRGYPDAVAFYGDGWTDPRASQAVRGVLAERK